MDSAIKPKTRVAFVLIDEVGDVSLPRLGDKTPPEAAKIPNLDAIASAGINGLMDPVEVGLGCGSDTAHLSLLGYDPRIYYQGEVHLSPWVLDLQCHLVILHSRWIFILVFFFSFFMLIFIRLYNFFFNQVYNR